MTAEIAIMNKHAVALAADSAVTIRNGDRSKVYNTNKLFMLSKFDPVGVMVYGNAELMGVPWETIIKSYRQELKDRCFDHLHGYGENLIEYLENNRAFFPREVQAESGHESIRRGLSIIRARIDEGVEEIIHRKRAIDDAELVEVVTQAIERAYSRVDDSTEIPTGGDFASEVEYEFSDFIETEVKNIFGKLPISTDLHLKLKSFSVGLLFKLLPINPESGLVIAGFGKNDFFPTLLSYRIQGVICERLKFIARDPVQTDWNERAIVIPFAQSEMVETFMDGIDPKLQDEVYRYLRKLFGEQYPEQVSKAFGGNKAKTAIIKKKLEDVGNVLVDGLIKQIDEHMQKQNSHPVLEAVEFLPKEELASMAESLVNLTSFKRRVTLETETVGGPIDVAVISKGDGFIWVKRKHYFDGEINRQFSANYYR